MPLGFRARRFAPSRNDDGHPCNCAPEAAAPSCRPMKFAAEGLHLIEPWLKSYGALAIFLIIYFESFGAPVPGETGVIAASLLASQGELSIAAVFIAVLAGAILGDSTGYLIGRFGGRRVLEYLGPYVKLTPERLTAVEERFHRG